jgi:hypothetical protein
MLASIALSACDKSIPVVTPEMDTQLMSSFQAGQTVLNCQIQCSLSWAADLHSFAQLDAQGDWHGLAIKIMQDGYASDLAYYYLGHASEGLGADQAALRYYRISGAIATGQNNALKCNNGGSGFNLCNGVALPNDLFGRIQTVEADLASKQAEAERETEANAPPARKTKHRTTHKPAAPPTSDADQWIEPPAVTR